MSSSVGSRHVLLKALREWWWRGLQSGTWPLCELIVPDKLGLILRAYSPEVQELFNAADSNETQDVFEGFVSEGYVRGGNVSGFLTFSGITDKGLAELGFDPNLERERIMLEALRGRHRRDARRGVWRTELTIYELAAIVCLDPADAEELFGSLIHEDYVQGGFEATLGDAPNDGDLIVRVDFLTREGLNRIGARTTSSGPTEVDSAIQEAQRASSEARELLAGGRRELQEARGEARRILHGARNEALRILDKASEAGEAQQERTKQETRDELNRIIERARNDIESRTDIALDTTPEAPDRLTNVTQNFCGNTSLEGVEDRKEGLEKGALKVTEVAQPLAACITLLIALSFPIGIIVLWLQLQGSYTYNFDRSLYAASVTSKIMVMGKIVDVLILSTLILLLLISLWVAFNFRYEWRNRNLPSAAVQGYSVVLSVPMVFLVFAVCVLVFRTDLFSNLGGPRPVDLFWHLLCIVGFVVVGAVIAGIFFWRSRTEVSVTQTTPMTEDMKDKIDIKNRWNRYSAFVALYLASTAAAVFWAGLGELSLPAVALTLKEQGSTAGLEEQEFAARSMSDLEEQQVTINLIANPEEPPQKFVLLSNFGSYWYVVDPCKHLLAIPNDLVDQATPITEDQNVIKNKDQCSNHPPAVVGDGANNASKNEGDLLKSSGTFSDPDANAPLILSVPDNTLGQFTDNGDSTWSWELNTHDDVRKDSIRVIATDDDGATATDSFFYKADNVAPKAAFHHPDVDEGSDVSLSLRGPSDPGREDTFTYAFDCDRGSYGDFRKSSSANCPTTDNGTRSVKAQIRDDDGGVTKYRDTMTIANVAPTATFKYPSAAINAGSGRFNLSLIEPSDPGTKDTFEYHFDCGSGTYWDWGASNSAHCSADGPGTLVTKAQIRDDDGGVSDEYTKTLQVEKVYSCPFSST